MEYTLRVNTVFGTSPLAVALAHCLHAQAATWLCNTQPSQHKLLWRYADVSTGEGLRTALAETPRIFLILDNQADTEAEGLFIAIRRLEPIQGVVVTPVGCSAPSQLAQTPHWSHIQVGPCWGLIDPIISRLIQRVALEKRIWLPSTQDLHSLSIPDAVTLCMAAIDYPGARWIAPADPANLTLLIEDLQRMHQIRATTRTMPLSACAWQLGVPRKALLHWLSGTPATRHTPGWEPTDWMGRAGWIR